MKHIKTILTLVFTASTLYASAQSYQVEATHTLLMGAQHGTVTLEHGLKFSFKDKHSGASLTVQWLRVHLPV